MDVQTQSDGADFESGTVLEESLANAALDLNITA